jgi:virulence factor Mce-like protein
MRRRPGQNAITANPRLIGGATVLATIVAVWLAYNANDGLPFVPTRTYQIELPDGASLVKRNEVREGGQRIGLITDLVPVRLPDGTTGAQATLSIDQNTPALPVDSSVAVRPRSTLSLKYLELDRGTSKRAIPDGGRLEVSNARSYVELDEVIRMFNEPTREGQTQSLTGFGNALAARGPSLNATIERLPRTFSLLEPVMRNLADQRTGLRTFVRELGDAARVVAPVSQAYAKSFPDGATTFEALARDEDALRDTIAKSPPTLAEGERSLREQQPFLSDFAELSENLETTARQATRAVPPLTVALRTGARVQPRTVALAERTEDVLISLGELVDDPLTTTALRALTATTTTLNPQLRFHGPRITVCNRWNWMWTIVAEHFTETDPTGYAQRAISNSADRQDNNVTSMGAVVPANGENVQPGGDPQHYHGQPFTAAVDAEGNADCEEGQRGYLTKLSTFSTQPERFNVVNDPRTPGLSGPLFDQIVDGKGVGRGPSRVPEGQTFTAEAETGPQLP